MQDLLDIFITSFVIGVLIAAPIGPVSVLCIRYSLKQNFIAGMLVGIGAASGDLIYAIIATISMDVINDYMASAEWIFQIIGGCFLLLLSIQAVINEKKINIDEVEQYTKLHDSKKYIFVISFFTTVLSPMTIMLFISLLSSADLELESTASYIVVPVGILIGTIGWMTAMAIVLQYIKHKITQKTAHYINLFSNISIAIFGIIAIYKGALYYFYQV